MERIIPIPSMYQSVMKAFKEKDYLASDIHMKELLDTGRLYANMYNPDRINNMHKFMEISLSNIVGTITNIDPDNMEITVKNIDLSLADMNVVAIPRALTSPDLEVLMIVTFDIKPD